MTDADVIYVYDTTVIVVEEEPITTIVIGEETPVVVIESIETGPQGPAGPIPTDVVKNICPSGGYRVTNIRMSADKKIMITYEEEPVE